MTVPARDSATFVADLHRVADGLRRLGATGWDGRREAVRELVQRWADLAADLEGEPRRAVPRLEGDPALADQLVVVGTDLAEAADTAPSGPAALSAGRRDLERLRVP